MGFFDFFKKKSANVSLEAPEEKIRTKNAIKYRQPCPFRDNLDQALAEGMARWKNADLKVEANMKAAYAIYFWVAILQIEYPFDNQFGEISLPEDILIKLNSDISFLYSGIIYYSYLDNFTAKYGYHRVLKEALTLSRSSFYDYFEKSYDSKILKKAVANVSSVKLGYDDIANDMAVVLIKYVLDIDMFSFKFIIIRRLITRWASAKMRLSYNLLMSTQRDTFSE